MVLDALEGARHFEIGELRVASTSRPDVHRDRAQQRVVLDSVENGIHRGVLINSKGEMLESGWQQALHVRRGPQVLEMQLPEARAAREGSCTLYRCTGR